MEFPAVAVDGGRVPSEWLVTIKLEVIEQFSEDSPARLRTELINEAQTARVFLSGYAPPFGPLNGHTVGGNRIYLVPDDESHGSAGHYPKLVPKAPVDGCWKLTTTLGSADVGLYMPTNPGESITMTYAVLNDREAADCLPPGEYRFEAEWGERYENDQDVWHSWEFVLTLQD